MTQQPIAKKRSAARSEGAGDLVAAVRSLKRKVEENLDQLALVHGVLEELCERQEALASWQMEYAKRTLSLGEAQWHALNAFSRRPGARAKAPLLGQVEARGPKPDVKPRTPVPALPDPDADDGFDDSLDEATEFLAELSGDLARRKDVRHRVMEERARSRGKSADADPANTDAKETSGERSGAKASASGKKGKSRKAHVAEEPVEEPLESILVLPEKTEFH